MEIRVRIDDIDYDGIINDLLPRLKERKDSKLLTFISGIFGMYGGLPQKMISAIPQEKKNALLAKAVNSNRQEIAAILTEYLGKKGIPIEVGDLEIIAK